MKDDSEERYDFGEQARSIAEQFGALNVGGMMGSLADNAMNSITPEHLKSLHMLTPTDLPELELDDSPWRTAAATEQMAEHTAALIGLTQAALDLAESSKASSDKVERFTRRMTWASLAIAVASLTVAIVALST